MLLAMLVAVAVLDMHPRLRVLPYIGAAVVGAALGMLPSVVLVVLVVAVVAIRIRDPRTLRVVLDTTMVLLARLY
jgi:hypothetical protein